MARQKPFRPQSGKPRRPAGAASRPGRPKGFGTGRPKPASFASDHKRPERDSADPSASKLKEAKTRKPKPKRDDASQADSDRLQKVLAHAGVDSRRACEELITQGRVTVDGKTVRELGVRVDPETSRIEVDGQRIKIEKLVYYAVNKPKGYVSTNDDPSGRPRVVDLLPEIPQRVYTVGRLDEDSTGLILLTNDGELANRLAHPRFGVEKLYRVLVAGLPTPEVLQRVTDGVWLADGKVRAKRVKIVGRQGEATTLELVLAEGKNREVRRIFAKLGHKVMSLSRIAVGPIPLKGLALGEFRTLSKDEIDLLQKVAAGIEVGPSRPKDRRPAGKGGPSRSKPAAPPKANDETGPQGPRPAKAPAPGVRLSFKPPGADDPKAIPTGPAKPTQSAPKLGPKVPVGGKIVPNMVLPSGAVVGARPGTGNRPSPANSRSDSRPSGPKGGDRRPPDSRERRPSGPSGAGRPSGPSGGRYAGPSGAGRPSGPSGGGRPSGTAGAGRPSGPGGPKLLGPKPPERPPGRKIIGLDPSVLPTQEKKKDKGRDNSGSTAGGGPERPEKSKQKRPPRAAHGVKRNPRDKDRG